MKQLIIVTAVLLCFSVSSRATQTAPSTKTGPEVIDLKTNTMPLKFPHKKHQAVLNNQCPKCHKPDDVTHKVWGTEIAHKTCLGCHRDMNKGPAECSKCHKLK